MAPNETRHGVWLGERRVGTLNQRGDHTWFGFTEEYREDPQRPVLGLVFEEDPDRRHSSSLRVPPWFSNLLPEGPQRRWIAAGRGVSVDREMELLAQVGHDLPGAVRVLAEDAVPEQWDPSADVPDPYRGVAEQERWRFSLAGVGLKFSMVSEGDRLTLPAHGEGGDWIVKLPDRVYPDVPRNEFAMMSLARAVGIDVPEIRLVHRSKLDRLPEKVWPNEEWAYAVERFDRADGGRRIHIEDLAQVRDFYPDGKYRGNYETAASLLYRRHDLGSLLEFVRRLVFSIMISNGDAHLKNWSLIYRDGRSPSISPAYDLVCTAPYRDDGPEDLALRLGGGERAFDRIGLRAFARLAERLRVAPEGVTEVVVETVDAVVAEWPRHAGLLDASPRLQEVLDASVSARAKTLLSAD
ncbi:type II toxin-antitoxin system HipA family toxin [Saccharopolyspora sp. CA-218241]|uniref:type II toxin-antitoxin system HipA family toxin n=1 Tax=Saccharopolyspora sp. CA-218241 TaxID=3240027 RepID=UPI003D96F739